MISPTEEVSSSPYRSPAYTWRIFGTGGFTNAGACVERRSSEKIERKAPKLARDTRELGPSQDAPDTRRVVTRRCDRRRMEERSCLQRATTHARTIAGGNAITGLFATLNTETRISDYRILDCDHVCVFELFPVCVPGSSPIYLPMVATR